MPCYVTGSREGDLELSLSESQEAATKATRMLCETLERIERPGFSTLAIDKLSKETQQFWKEHKEIDKERKRREAEEVKLKAIKKNALRKLSKEEKKVLGLESK